MKKLKTFFIALLVIAVATASGAAIFRRGQQIKAQAPTAWTEDHRADCAVVLTGGSGRVREGFDLLAQNMVRKLIISGVYSGATLREIFPEWPFYGQLNEEDVVLEKRSLTTFGNAVQSLALVEAIHCRGIVLVTSRLHMPRAYKTFREVYPEGYSISQRAIIGGYYIPRWPDLYLEVVKSLFYDIWAY